MEPSSSIELGMRMLESKKRLPSAVVCDLSPAATLDQSTSQDSKRRRLESASALKTIDISSLGDNHDSDGFRFTSIHELKKSSTNGHLFPTSPSMFTSHPSPIDSRNGFTEHQPTKTDSHSLNYGNTCYKIAPVSSSEASIRRRIPYMSPAELDALFQSKKNGPLKPSLNDDSRRSDMDDFSPIPTSRIRAQDSPAPRTQKQSAPVDIDLQYSSPQRLVLSESSSASNVNTSEAGPLGPRKVNSVAQFIASLEAHGSHSNASATEEYATPHPRWKSHLSEHHLSPSDLDSRVSRIRNLLSSSSSSLVSSPMPSLSSSVCQSGHSTTKTEISPFMPVFTASVPSILTSSASLLTPLNPTWSTTTPIVTCLPSSVNQPVLTTQLTTTPSFTFSFPTITKATATSNISDASFSSSESKNTFSNLRTTSAVSSVVISTSSSSALFSLPTTPLSVSIASPATSVAPFASLGSSVTVATSSLTSTVSPSLSSSIITTSLSLSPFKFPSISATSSVATSSVSSPLTLFSFGTANSSAPSTQPPTTMTSALFSLPTKPSFAPVTSVLSFGTSVVKSSESSSGIPTGTSVTGLSTAPLFSVATTSSSAPLAISSVCTTSASSGQPFQFGTASNVHTTSSPFSHSLLTSTSASLFSTSSTAPATILSNGGVTLPAISSSTGIATFTAPSLGFSTLVSTTTTTTTTASTNPVFSFSSLKTPFPFSLASTTNSAAGITATTMAAPTSSVAPLFSFGTLPTVSSSTATTTSSFSLFGSAISSNTVASSLGTSLPASSSSSAFSLGMKSTAGSATNITTFGAPSLFGKIGDVPCTSSNPFNVTMASTVSSSPFTFSTVSTSSLSGTESAHKQPFQFGTSASSGLASSFGGGAFSSSAISGPNLFTFGQPAASQSSLQTATNSSTLSTAPTTNLFQFGSSSNTTTPTNMGFNFIQSSTTSSALGSTQPPSTNGFVFGQPALSFGAQPQPTGNPFTFGTTSPNLASTAVVPKRRPIATRRTRRP
ncbi:unnamed protein product [Dicrocoelium dendriticum]|nr:unnamed protein product [Dicrocoelium dendriticum]